MPEPASEVRARRLPRPPREATGPLLIHTPEGPPTVQVARGGTLTVDPGPAWVKAPQPQYHAEVGVHLIEPPQVPSGVSDAKTSKIRCPKCKETFTGTTQRPAQVVCPHCGAKGALK